MFRALLLALQLIQMPKDPVRAAEIQERALVERSKQHDREVLAQQDLQQRNFELKFNQFTDAIASFAKQYNQGKGQVWPQREAQRLRNAMIELQALEKSLRGAPNAAVEAENRGATASVAR